MSLPCGKHPNDTLGWEPIYLGSNQNEDGHWQYRKLRTVEHKLLEIITSGDKEWFYQGWEFYPQTENRKL